MLDKRWTVVLDEALPSAWEEGKTFHSFRHFGNMEMILALVLDPIREPMMGHEGATVNSRHYKKTLKPEKLRTAVAARRALYSRLGGSSGIPEAHISDVRTSG